MNNTGLPETIRPPGELPYKAEEEPNEEGSLTPVWIVLRLLHGLRPITGGFCSLRLVGARLKQ